MKFLYKEFVSEYFRKEESKQIKEMNAIPVIFEVLENINSDTRFFHKFAFEKDLNIDAYFNFPKHVKFKLYIQIKAAFMLIEPNEKVIEIYEMFKDPNDEILYVLLILENNFEFNYKKTTNELERKQIIKQINKNCPTKIPIILEKNPDCIFSKELISKYLFPKDCEFNILKNYIKKKLNFFYDIKFYIKGYFLMDNDDELISNIYEIYKDENDGILYISYEIEMNKIPIMIQNNPENDIFKVHKILINKNMNISNFIKIFKKRNNLDENLQLKFLIKSNQIENNDLLLFDLYNHYKDSDEILKIDCSIII